MKNSLKILNIIFIFLFPFVVFFLILCFFKYYYFDNIIEKNENKYSIINNSFSNIKEEENKQENKQENKINNNIKNNINNKIILSENFKNEIHFRYIYREKIVWIRNPKKDYDFFLNFRNYPNNIFLMEEDESFSRLWFYSKRYKQIWIIVNKINNQNQKIRIIKHELVHFNFYLLDENKKNELRWKLHFIFLKLKNNFNEEKFSFSKNCLSIYNLNNIDEKFLYDLKKIKIILEKNYNEKKYWEELLSFYLTDLYLKYKYINIENPDLNFIKKNLNLIIEDYIIYN